MRLSHVQQRADQLIHLKDIIESAYDNLINSITGNINDQQVRTRIEFVEKLWNQFKVIHDAIMISSKQLSIPDWEVLFNHPYFNNNIFQLTHDIYLKTLALHDNSLEIQTREGRESVASSSGVLSIIPSPINSTSLLKPPNFTGSLSENHPVHYHLGSRLPQIDLPKFDGNPNNWLTFRDLFKSLVCVNATLSDIERLQYLNTCLMGTAANLLKNTPLTADSFSKSWDFLTDFYENTRLLVNSTFQSLMSIKRISHDSASDLEKLYTSLTQLYRTFETLQRPVQYWDDFLIFISVQRLDPGSVKAWEQHLGVRRDSPTWQQFLKFLSTRLLTRQAFERSIDQRSSHDRFKRPIKALVTNSIKEKSNSESKLNCLLCNGTHFLNQCSQFRNSSHSQKLNVIKKFHLCFNCFGKHQSSNCSSLRRCQRCGKKHHTLIHYSSSKPDNTVTTLPTQPNIESTSLPTDSNL